MFFPAKWSKIEDEKEADSMYQPLADELRPKTLDEVYGQEEILGRRHESG